MNAISTIERAEPAYYRYLPAVDALRPEAERFERRQRAGLMLLRDMAAKARRTTASPDASLAFWTIEQIAGEHCVGDMPNENLFALRRGLANMWSAAMEVAAASTPDE